MISEEELNTWDYLWTSGEWVLLGTTKNDASIYEPSTMNLLIIEEDDLFFAVKQKMIEMGVPIVRPRKLAD